MVRDVSANARQFDYKDDLKEAIIVAWYRIPQETLQTLSASMRRRLHKLVKNEGGETRY